MEAKEFVHLHLHSEYSLLDGAIRVADIPKLAKQMGHEAVALTDHGNLYGAVAFYTACKKEGIKPIIGCEVYVAPQGRFSKTVSREGKYYHLTLLVENAQGYRNLCKMVSLSYTEGFYGKPRVDEELLKAYAEGLICLSGCMGGYIPQCIEQGDFDKAREAARRLARLFGPDRFYIELQNHHLPEERDVMEYLCVMAQELHLPCVATNDAHYPRRMDARMHEVLLCIQMNRTVDAGRPLGFLTDEFYYKSTQEMEQVFAEHPQALHCTKEIADRCQFDFTFDQLFLPVFETPDGTSAEQFLRALAEQGYLTRVKSGALVPTEKHPEQEYRTRIAYELDVICRMGYAEYYLIVWDFVQYAKTHGIPTGPGRGSGAGSLVAFLIGITDVDSIRYDLMFERFLNPERISMPDFDVDFCYERRAEVIAYVTQKYGADRVAQIITFGTLAARAAVRDTGRALGLPYALVDSVAKCISNEHGITLAQAAKQGELADRIANEPVVKELIHTAMQLEGMPRHASTHAAGVVITDKPVYEYVPLAENGGQVVTQFDMDTVAKLGLLKIDFLGLRYLTVIADAEREIRRTEPSFSVAAQPLTDAATYAMLGAGHSGGVFQLESAGMRQLLQNMRPQCLEDIVAAIALYRPGPMNFIPQFLENRAAPQKVKYLVPQLRDILSVTNGCIVYQEQVMQIFRTVAGYSLGRADVVRRAMSKKKTDVMEQERALFLQGAAANGVDTAAAEQLFDEMAGFAKYAFNKCHAVAYAYLSYRTAYLLCHYPAEYLAALLSSLVDNTPKMTEYIAQAARLGIVLLSADINESEQKFAVVQQGDRCGIRFGLCAVKGVGNAFAEKIVAERRAHGAFTKFEDFIVRMADKELNRRSVEPLIRCGAFDTLEPSRAKLIVSYEILIDAVQQRAKQAPVGQIDLFAASGMETPPEQQALYFPQIPLPQVEEFSLREKLLMEKETTGQYFSGHMLDDYTLAVAQLQPDSIHEILLSAASEDTAGHYHDKQSVRLAGWITRRVNKQTRKGEPMAFLTLEDRYGEIELIAFPQVLSALGDVLLADSAISAEGELSLREDEPPKVLLRRVAPLVPNAQFSASAAALVKQKPQPAQTGGTLYISLPSLAPQDALYRRCLAILQIFPGESAVVLHDRQSGKYLRAQGLRCHASQFVLQQLQALVGPNHVALREKI